MKKAFDDFKGFFVIGTNKLLDTQFVFRQYSFLTF
jgi:hypothetical protein